MSKMTTLVEDFQEYFDLHAVRTPAQMAQVYSIRYRVYCEEFGYEPSENFPDREESDAFDAHDLSRVAISFRKMLSRSRTWTCNGKEKTIRV